MNFFEHQVAARRNSRRLVVLFALAVIAIVIAVNVAATVLFQMFAAPVGLRWQSGTLPNGFYFTNTVVVLGLIFGGTLLEINRLKAGGVAVAQMVGAREVDTSTRDLLDRRLVNIVEEMAIASGVPMPRVFVMDAETIGQDLVNHCENDIAVCGAEPLFFLDYMAFGKLDPSVASEIVKGFSIACKENGCALIGGETAGDARCLSDWRLRSFWNYCWNC